MKKNNNVSKFNDFRLLYPVFTFEKYDITIDGDVLKMVFSFNISDKYYFTPSISIPNVSRYGFIDGEGELMRNIVFHIGMVELISYWKLTCSPKIIVKPKKMNEDMIRWWKELYFNGLGEFFYLNEIDAKIDTFVEIESDSISELSHSVIDFECNDSYLVPIGGGKDSVVTLSLLRDAGYDVKPFIINPRGATIECVKAAGYSMEEVLVVERRLDPLMLKLNAEGFLNGHTPFSALLAFVSLLAATITGRLNIALSNESSANESTVKDTEVNHQYSKSYKFESDFRGYVDKYISSDFNYFSFLRPLSELKIASLFAKRKEFYPVFKSCNVGSKDDVWCCNCPKCLFVYTILSPFIPTAELIKIFGEEMFNKESMLPYLDELMGKSDVKPFECVGTVDEVRAALFKAIERYEDKPLPLLLNYFKNSELYNNSLSEQFDKIMESFDENNFLSDNEQNILK